MSSARDSGISVENDDSPNEKQMCKLTHVQTLKQRFELLCTTEIQHEFHPDTNWWLHERSKNSTKPIFRDMENDDSISNDDNYNYQVHDDNVINDMVIVNALKGQSDSLTEMSEPKEEMIPDKGLSVVKLSQDDDQGPNETNVDDLESDHENDSIDSFEDTDGEELSSEQFIENLTRPVSLASRSSQNSNKLSNIIKELLENEQSYVDSLERGIKNYVGALDKSDIPKTLRGQKFRIFGNVENIYKFHKFEFLPKLIECNENVSEIADTFISYLQKDYFYGYVLYAINSKKSERLCNNHVEFFQKAQDECADRLGVNSFLLQPIQRLPRYKMLLMEVIKELGNTLESVKDQIAACCIAEKNMQRLLDTVNESMSINDLHECYEIPKNSIGLGMEMFNALPFLVGENSNEPVLYLVPKFSPLYGYRLPINLLSQGKFKRMSEFEVYECAERRRYRGKVFLFERCILYTEQIDKEHLIYKGHYEDDKLGMTSPTDNKFKLFSQRFGQQEIDFSSDSSTVTDWVKRINEILMISIDKEKKKNETLKLNKTPVSRLAPNTDSIRSSMLSTTSSTVSSLRSSSGSSKGSFDIQKSQWYV